MGEFNIKWDQRDLLFLMEEKEALDSLPVTPERGIKSAKLLREMAILREIISQQAGQKERPCIKQSRKTN